jgi:hypothetical protein
MHQHLPFNGVVERRRTQEAGKRREKAYIHTHDNEAHRGSDSVFYSLI